MNWDGKPFECPSQEFLATEPMPSSDLRFICRSVWEDLEKEAGQKKEEEFALARQQRAQREYEERLNESKADKKMLAAAITASYCRDRSYAEETAKLAAEERRKPARERDMIVIAELLKIGADARKLMKLSADNAKDEHVSLLKCGQEGVLFIMQCRGRDNRSNPACTESFAARLIDLADSYDPKPSNQNGRE